MLNRTFRAIFVGTRNEINHKQWYKVDGTEIKNGLFVDSRGRRYTARLAPHWSWFRRPSLEIQANNHQELLPWQSPISSAQIAHEYRGGKRIEISIPITFPQIQPFVTHRYTSLRIPLRSLRRNRGSVV